MKKNRFLIFLCALLFLCSISVNTQNSFKNSIVKADAQNIQVDGNKVEHFDSIDGRDITHPVWPVRSLGVIVYGDNDPALLKSVSEACDAWSPVFDFHNYGYVPERNNFSLDCKKNLRYVAIMKKDLPYINGNKVLGITFTPSSSRGAFLGISGINIYIDTKYIETHNLSMRAVIAHELGHAIGLHHSDDADDFMSPYLPRQFKIDAEDFQLVNRLYAGIPVVKMPSDLPVDVNNRIESYQPQITSDNSKKKNSFIFRTRKGYPLIYQIEDSLILINETHFVSQVQGYIEENSLKRGHRNYTNAWKNIPNGRYMAHIIITYKNFEPSSKNRKYSLVMTNTDTYENPIPDHQILCRVPDQVLPAYQRSLTINFKVGVKVKNHHYSYLISKKYHNKLYSNIVNP